MKSKVDLSELQGVFFSSILTSQFSGKYDFATMCNQSRLKDELISLPATPSGDPDWDYMENYMESVMEREEVFAEHLAPLTEETITNGHEIDVSDWGKFRVGDLGFKVYHGSRLNKCNRIDGNITFLTAGKENQGVAGYIGNNIQVYTDAISIDMFGNCFYHKGDCAGDDNIYFFINNTISDLCKLFLACCINDYLQNDYSYAHQFRQTNADMLCISLPVTPTGDPDWDYMEQFMQKKMAVAEYYATHLDAICET